MVLACFRWFQLVLHVFTSFQIVLGRLARSSIQQSTGFASFWAVAQSSIGLGLFWVALGRFRSPFGLVWLVSGCFNSFLVSFILILVVLAHFASFCLVLAFLGGCFSWFWVLLARFRSPFGSFWLVFGHFCSFKVSFQLVLACFNSLWVVFARFRSPFGSFWFVLRCFWLVSGLFLACFGLFWLLLAGFDSYWLVEQLSVGQLQPHFLMDKQLS